MTKRIYVMEPEGIRFTPGAHIFGVSLEQDLRWASELWGRKRRAEVIRMILMDWGVGND